MKTLLLTALTFTGIALGTPEAQARDHRSYDRGCDSYRSSRSYGHSYYRSEREPRYYSSRSYYSEPHHYYQPSRSYSYSDRCEPERRRSFRPPLISFLFGF